MSLSENISGFDLQRFSNCRILVIGDLMIDEYLWGEVERISPEAPVQIVEVTREEFTLGGAGNVINNLVSLGAEVRAVSAVGTGHDGNLLLKMLEGMSVDIEGVIQDPNRPTTRKTRIIASNQHVLRIDRETKKEISPDTYRLMIRYLEKYIQSSDIVLVSDYGKGILAKPLLSRLTQICKIHGKMIIVDPKGLDFVKYAGATLITPNKKEASLASNMEITGSSDLYRAAASLFEKVKMDNLLITCGKDGMVLFEKDKPPYHIHTEARQVFDVSGAGDTVLAVIGLACAGGATFRQAALLANFAAGIVVGKMGTAAVTQIELASVITPGHSDTCSKFREISELKVLVSHLRRKGLKIVLTNGCFDLLHAGHIRLLSESRKLGDVLILAIDDDSSVRKLKGPGRPVISQNNRVRILCALDSVDYVVVFPSDELMSVLDIVRPDFLTKGSNYSSDEIFGRRLVEKHGGTVRIIAATENISSSSIINSIKNNAG